MLVNTTEIRVPLQLMARAGGYRAGLAYAVMNMPGLGLWLWLGARAGLAHAVMNILGLGLELGLGAVTLMLAYS